MEVMDDDNFDLYGDLEEFDYKQKFTEQESVANGLRTELEQCKKKLETVEAANKFLNQKLETIKLNFHSLLATAKLEVKRKDTQIAALRKEKDDLIFRRGNRPHPYQKAENPFAKSLQNTENEKGARTSYHQKPNEKFAADYSRLPKSSINQSFPENLFSNTTASNHNRSKEPTVNIGVQRQNNAPHTATSNHEQSVSNEPEEKSLEIVWDMFGRPIFSLPAEKICPSVSRPAGKQPPKPIQEQGISVEPSLGSREGEKSTQNRHDRDKADQIDLSQKESQVEKEKSQKHPLKEDRDHDSRKIHERTDRDQKYNHSSSREKDRGKYDRSHDRNDNRNYKSDRNSRERNTDPRKYGQKTNEKNDRHVDHSRNPKERDNHDRKYDGQKKPDSKEKSDRDRDSYKTDKSTKDRSSVENINKYDRERYSREKDSRGRKQEPDRSDSKIDKPKKDQSSRTFDDDRGYSKNYKKDREKNDPHSSKERQSHRTSSRDGKTNIDDSEKNAIKRRNEDDVEREIKRKRYDADHNRKDDCSNASKKKEGSEKEVKHDEKDSNKRKKNCKEPSIVEKNQSKSSTTGDLSVDNLKILKKRLEDEIFGTDEEMEQSVSKAIRNNKIDENTSDISDGSIFDLSLNACQRKIATKSDGENIEKQTELSEGEIADDESFKTFRKSKSRSKSKEKLIGCVQTKISSGENKSGAKEENIPENFRLKCDGLLEGRKYSKDTVAKDAAGTKDELNREKDDFKANHKTPNDTEQTQIQEEKIDCGDLAEERKQQDNRNVEQFEEHREKSESPFQVGKATETEIAFSEHSDHVEDEKKLAVNAPEQDTRNENDEKEKPTIIVAPLVVELSSPIKKTKTTSKLSQSITEHQSRDNLSNELNNSAETGILNQIAYESYLHNVTPSMNGSADILESILSDSTKKTKKTPRKSPAIYRSKKMVGHKIEGFEPQEWLKDSDLDTSRELKHELFKEVLGPFNSTPIKVVDQDVDSTLKELNARLSGENIKKQAAMSPKQSENGLNPTVARVENVPEPENFKEKCNNETTKSPDIQSSKSSTSSSSSSNSSTSSSSSSSGSSSDSNSSDSNSSRKEKDNNLPSQYRNGSQSNSEINVQVVEDTELGAQSPPSFKTKKRKAMAQLMSDLKKQSNPVPISNSPPTDCLSSQPDKVSDRHEKIEADERIIEINGSEATQGTADYSKDICGSQEFDVTIAGNDNNDQNTNSSQIRNKIETRPENNDIVDDDNGRVESGQETESHFHDRAGIHNQNADRTPSLLASNSPNRVCESNKSQSEISVPNQPTERKEKPTTEDSKQIPKERQNTKDESTTSGKVEILEVQIMPDGHVFQNIIDNSEIVAKLYDEVNRARSQSLERSEQVVANPEVTNENKTKSELTHKKSKTTGRQIERPFKKRQRRQSPNKNSEIHESSSEIFREDSSTPTSEIETITQNNYKDPRSDKDGVSNSTITKSEEKDQTETVIAATTLHQETEPALNKSASMAVPTSSNNSTLNDSNNSEKRNISIASSNYVIETVSPHVVNVFITRNKIKKKKKLRGVHC